MEIPDELIKRAARKAEEDFMEKKMTVELDEQEVIELINKTFDDFRETTSVKNTIQMLDIVQRVLIRDLKELETEENETR